MTTTTNPTALNDQLHAASRHAEQVIRGAAAAGHGQLSEDQPGPWLTEQVTLLRLALLSGTASACPHLGSSPRVVHAAVWAPGLLVCSTCIKALTPDPIEDTTCDRCRRHVRRIHAATTALGPVLLTYGLCRRCHTDTTTAPPTPRKDTHR